MLPSISSSRLFTWDIIFSSFKQKLLEPDISMEEKFTTIACTTCYVPIKVRILPQVFYKQWQCVHRSLLSMVCARGDLFPVSSSVSPIWLEATIFTKMSG